MYSKLSKPQLLDLLEKKDKELEARSSELKQSETKVAQLRATLETFSQKISQTNIVIEEHQSLVLRHAEMEKQLVRERAIRIKLQKAHASKGPGSASSPIAETASCANLSTAAAGSDNARETEEVLSRKLREEQSRREAAEKLLEEHQRSHSLSALDQAPDAISEEISRLREALRTSESELKGLRAASKDLFLAQGTMQEEKKRLLQELGRAEEGKRQALRRASELEASLKEAKGLKGPLAIHSLQDDPVLRELRRKLGESEAGRRKAEKETLAARHTVDSLKEEMRQAPRQDSCPPSSFSLPSAAQQATAGVGGAASDRRRSEDHFSRFECQLKKQMEQMAKMQSEIKWLRKKVEPTGDEEHRGTSPSDQSLAVTRSGGESPAPFHNNGNNAGESDDDEELFVGFSSKRREKRGREEADDPKEGQQQKGAFQVQRMKVGSAPGSSSSPRKRRLIKQNPIAEILYPITHGHARRAAVILGEERCQTDSVSGFSAAPIPTLLTVRNAARKLIEAHEGGHCTWEEVTRVWVSSIVECARDERELEGLPLPPLPSAEGPGSKKREGGDSSNAWMGWCSSESKRRGVIKFLVSLINVLDDGLVASTAEEEEPRRSFLPLVLNDISKRLSQDQYRVKVSGGMSCTETCALLSAAGLLLKESGGLSEFRALVLNVLDRSTISWSSGRLFLSRDQFLMLASLSSQWPGCIACPEEDVIGRVLQFILSRASFSKLGSTTGDQDGDRLMEDHRETVNVMIQWLRGDECSLDFAAKEAAEDQMSKVNRILSPGYE